MKKLLNDAAHRAIRYRESLADRSVAPTQEALAGIQRFSEELPDVGFSAEETLALLDEVGSPATMAMAGPRFFGFVIGGSLPVTVASNWLSTAWDQNVSMHEVTPAAARLEQVSLDWLVDLLQLPPGCGGGFVTGTTVANFVALAAARHRVYDNAGWDIEANGLIGAPGVTVIVGAEAHPTLTKSLGMLGFGRNRVVRVPTDDNGRMRLADLPGIVGPTIVCTQAGNVNTGAFDPIGEICDIVRPQGAWVHVDGAFGLWAAASPRLRDRVDGIGKADSWSTDAHKWLNVPYDSGVSFVRNPNDLKAAMAITADYLITDSAFRNPSDYVPELSRRGRGIDIWAALRTLGRNGLVAMIEQSCAHAQHFASELSAAGFEILNDVELNQVLVSFGDAEATRNIIGAIQRDGTCWCGATVWQDKTAMRISVSNASTTTADVQLSVDAIVRIANSVLGRGN